MKVSGFTIVRNAVQYDYPAVESIKSILPLCDEVVVAVGKSEDDTRGLIEKLDPQKVKIIDTIWDDSKRSAGLVLAEETNKALQATDPDSDWCIYIQADEVLHEQDYPALQQAMEKYCDDKHTDGLLLRYKHFYGSYHLIGTSPRWYSHEVRVVRRNREVYSYRDAQGFRKGNDEKLRVREVEAYVHHYGWVKRPQTMQKKWEGLAKLYHNDEWMHAHSGKEAYDFDEGIDWLETYTGTHPAVMQERVGRQDWEYHYDFSRNRLSNKYKYKRLADKYLGLRLSYQNFKRIR